MRNLFTVLFAGLAIVALSAGRAAADSVEVKGPHICCKQCVTVVGKILEKVDGVSDVSADAKTKTVKFTAKNAAAAKAGFKALIDGGFSGKATSDGKELESGLLPLKSGDKADKVVVKDVHVCCGACQNAINAMFKSAKVAYSGKGPQRTVTIEGTALDRGEIINALRSGGFNGSLEK